MNSDVNEGKLRKEITSSFTFYLWESDISLFQQPPVFWQLYYITVSHLSSTQSLGTKHWHKNTTCWHFFKIKPLMALALSSASNCKPFFLYNLKDIWAAAVPKQRWSDWVDETKTALWTWAAKISVVKCSRLLIMQTFLIFYLVKYEPWLIFKFNP